MAEYKSRSSLIGREVTITDSVGARVETVTDISRDGKLVTTDEFNRTHEYISGDVTVRHG